MCKSTRRSSIGKWNKRRPSARQVKTTVSTSASPSPSLAGRINDERRTTSHFISAFGLLMENARSPFFSGDGARKGTRTPPIYVDLACRGRRGHSRRSLETTARAACTSGCRGAQVTLRTTGFNDTLPIEGGGRRRPILVFACPGKALAGASCPP